MTSSLPLSGYKVLDLTQARAGPTAVRLLTDWGATVYRIVPPPSAALMENDHSGQDDPDTQNLHRNKRGISLDLKSSRGLELFMTLVESSDVIVENFRADVKHRLGVDYEAVLRCFSAGLGVKMPVCTKFDFNLK